MIYSNTSLGVTLYSQSHYTGHATIPVDFDIEITPPILGIHSGHNPNITITQDSSGIPTISSITPSRPPQSSFLLLSYKHTNIDCADNLCKIPVYVCRKPNTPPNILASHSSCRMQSENDFCRMSILLQFNHEDPDQHLVLATNNDHSTLFFIQHGFIVPLPIDASLKSSIDFYKITLPTPLRYSQSRTVLDHENWPTLLQPLRRE